MWSSDGAAGDGNDGSEVTKAENTSSEEAAGPSSNAKDDGAEGEASNPGMRRVKVYQLNEQGQWDDRGTGHVTYSRGLDPVLGGEGLTLIVKDENSEELLLDHKWEDSIEYQRQGDTIITWCDEVTGNDLALSFEEVERCIEIWEQIAREPAGGGMQHPELDETNQDFLDDQGRLTLPPPTQESLESIFARLQHVGMSQRDNVARCVLEEGFLDSLFACVEAAEGAAVGKGSSSSSSGVNGDGGDDDVGGEGGRAVGSGNRDDETLRLLFHIYRSLLALNDSSVLAALLDDRHIMQCVHALEHDPDFPQASRTRHRDFLQRSCFKDVFGFDGEEEAVGKAKQSYRVTYIRDVILPGCNYLEDPARDSLSNTILTNNMTVISRLAASKDFVPKLLCVLNNFPAGGAMEPPADAKVRSARRKEAFLLLRELFVISRHLHKEDKDGLYRRLLHHDLLPCVERSLVSFSTKNKKAKFVWLACMDVLTALLAHDPDLIRDYMMARAEMHKAGGEKQQRDPSLFGALLGSLCDHRTGPGIMHQLAQVLKMLLDPEPGPEPSIFLEQVYGNHFEQRLLHVFDVPLPATTNNSQAAAGAAATGASGGVTATAFSPPSTKTTAPSPPSASTSSSSSPSSSASSSSSSSAAATRRRQNSDGLGGETPGVGQQQKHQVEGHYQAKFQACELLSFCLYHHGARAKTYLLRRNTLAKLRPLLSLQHRPDVFCAALRLLRRCLALKDEAYVRAVLSHKLLDAVMDVFLKNGARYNLLNSAVIELLNFVRCENIKPLVTALVTDHLPKFQGVNYVRTFQELSQRHQQNLEFEKDGGVLGGERSGLGDDDDTSWFREYEYFNRDSDDESAASGATSGSEGTEQSDSVPLSPEDAAKAEQAKQEQLRLEEQREREFEEKTKELERQRKQKEEDEASGFDFSRVVKKKSAGKGFKNGSGAGSKHKLLGGGPIRLSLSKSLNAASLSSKFKVGGSIEAAGKRLNGSSTGKQGEEAAGDQAKAPKEEAEADGDRHDSKRRKV